jgi:hypothetical protein
MKINMDSETAALFAIIGVGLAAVAMFAAALLIPLLRL